MWREHRRAACRPTYTPYRLWEPPRTTLTDTLHCTVDTSRVASEDAEKVSAGAIRTKVEKEMRAITKRVNWRCRAVTLDRKNPNRIRIACGDATRHIYPVFCRLTTGSRSRRLVTAVTSLTASSYRQGQKPAPFSPLEHNLNTGHGSKAMRSLGLQA